MRDLVDVEKEKMRALVHQSFLQRVSSLKLNLPFVAEFRSQVTLLSLFVVKQDKAIPTNSPFLLLR